MEYYIHLGILICIYLILAQSFNLCFGIGLLFNLAHVASYAVGAYATALLATEAGVGLAGCLFASFSLSAVFALLVGGISTRLKQDYFAIGTLAFAAIVNALLINWKSLTRGVLGIPGIPRPEVAGVVLNENVDFLMLAASCAFVILVVLWFVFHSPFARSLRAMASYEPAAASLGMSPLSVRGRTFILASGIAGIAGSLFAFYINFIDPSSFSLNEMIFVLSVVVVGRPGSYWGCIVATTFLVLLPEALRWAEVPNSILGPMRQFLYAAILFFVVFVFRETLFPVEREV